MSNSTQKLPTRKIGDLAVSAIGLGCMPMSNPSKIASRAQSIETIQAALDSGVTLLDTADIYAPSWDTVGHNEILVAEALRTWSGDKSSVVVATKGGITRGPGESWGRDGSVDHLRRAVDASATRLGVDRIQVWQHHRMDPSISFEKQFANVLSVRADGIVERIALSNVTVEELNLAIEMGGRPEDGGVVSVQNERSPLFRDQDGVLDICTEYGIAYLPWSPLGGTARAREDGSHLQEFVKVADQRGSSVQTIALAWLLAASPMMIPIPGASRPESIIDSVKAVQIELTSEEFQRLDGAVSAQSSTFPDDQPLPALR